MYVNNQANGGYLSNRGGAVGFALGGPAGIKEGAQVGFGLGVQTAVVSKDDQAVDETAKNL